MPCWLTSATRSPSMYSPWAMRLHGSTSPWIRVCSSSQLNTVRRIRVSRWRSDSVGMALSSEF